MSDPSLGDQPATMKDFWPADDPRLNQYIDRDNGGVHINSGIPNHAFYLLASGLQSGGIGIVQARNIFYRALVTKLNSDSDFHDLRTACVQSAQELFGAESTQVTKTRQAFDQVLIFDRSALPAPSNLTPPSGPDAYLISYEATDGNYYLGRREAAFGETGTTVRSISGYAIDPDSRPTVTANGAYAAHVTAGGNFALAPTDGSSATSQLVDFGGLANAISISADGKYLAVIGRNAATQLPTPEIYYGNLQTGVGELISLYLPVADGPNTIQITRVDEVDLSPDGQYALFDGMAETKLPNGTTVRGWTIFGIDLKTKQVFSLLPPSSDAAYGNPSFSRTSTQRLVFEVISNTSAAILAVDAGRGTYGIVRQYPYIEFFMKYPRYSAADNFIVFAEDFRWTGDNNYYPRVARISLQSDNVTPTGSSTTLLDFAVNGLSYRRGNFTGAPVIAVQALNQTIPGGTSGKFRISRISGDQAIPVAVSFKPTGSAIPDVDYARLTAFATLPAGQSFVDVNVSALITPGALSKTLTLTIDPLMHYVVSESASSATATLTAPTQDYAYWAATQGVGVATADDDGDGFANLIEYATGTDAKAATPANSLRIQKASDGLLSFAQLRLLRTLKREGITFTLQRSADNTNWINAGTAVVADSASELILRDSLAVDPGVLRCLRIVVTEQASNTSVATKTCYWAGIDIANLTQTYDGQPKSVSVTTTPTGFNRTVTYDGLATAPVSAGSYAVLVQPETYTNLIGEAHATLNIGKASQAISFAAIPDTRFSKIPLPLSASASSGLPVEFNLTAGAGTLSGSLLNFAAPGPITVRARQSGDANYLPAPDISRSFTVLESYDWWKESEFTSQESGDPAISGPQARLSFDGMPNLLKYALAIGARDSAAPDWAQALRIADRWTFDFVRPVDRTDISYVVEASTDLLYWSDNGVTLEFVGNTPDGQRWRASTPAASSDRIFFRLKVNRP